MASLPDNTAEDLNQKTSQEVRFQELARVVPKFCTSVNLDLLNNNNLILTMLYNDASNNTALIERIVIDVNHAKSLHEVLGNILKEASDANT